MRRLAIALVPLFLFACDREPVAPNETPSFNGGSVLNEIVYAHPVRVTWLDTDRDAGQPWDVFLLGYDPADDPTCHGGAVVGGIPIRQHWVVTRMEEGFDIEDPSTWDQGEGFHNHVTTIGSAPLYMYSRATLPVGATDAEWCEYYKNDWMASGHWTANLYMDNDVTFEEYTPGMNVYGTNERGVLLGTDGTRYKYLWKWLAQWNPETGVFGRVLYDFDHVERVGN